VSNDGKRLAYNKWHSVEPNNYNIENCVHGLFYSNGFWNDIACNRTYATICYTDKPKTSIVNNEELQLVAVDVKVDYYTAIQHCQGKQMHLVRIENENINEAVQEFAVKSGLGDYWIDANDNKDDGSWVYSDGTSIIYNKWYPGQPSRNSPKNCVNGLILNDGSWYTANCNKKFYVICQKNTVHIDTLNTKDP